MSSSIIDDFKLLELVQQNNHLYDKNNPDYRDTLKKTITWKAIGAILGASGELCRKRFRGLRDRFNKERKVRQEEMLTDPSLPIIYKKMLFLWDHLTHRRLVPVATRLLLMPAEEVTLEIEKQILKMKEEGTEAETPEPTARTSEAEDASNEEIIDNNLPTTIPNTPKENFVRNSEVTEENAPLISKLVTENSDNTLEQSSQILFIRKVTESNLEGRMEKEDDPSSTKGKSTNERVNELEQPNDKSNISGNATDISGKNNMFHQRNKILPIANVKRKFLQSNLQCALPKAKRIMPHNVIEGNLKDVELQANSIVPNSRPSCNEAFCIVVKSYLDKITNPERLSAARLQILTTLHNELYSTYS